MQKKAKLLMQTFRALPALLLILACAVTSASAQQPAPSRPAPALPSAADVQALMAQIEQTGQTTVQAIGDLRIRKWKADSEYKDLSQHNAESLQRNLTSALPVLTGAVRTAPQDLGAAFKLYRNVNALYDVLKSLTESAGAFGPKEDFQALGQSAMQLEQERMTLADYLEAMAQQQTAELKKLRAHAATPVPAPKKIIVDNEPEKKPAKKKKPR